MITSIYILNGLSHILRETVEDLRPTYPDLRVSGCNLNSKVIWNENFEFIYNRKKINNIYTKGKLEISVHSNGRKVKELSLENLITSISLNFLLEGEMICFYKWEFKKSSGLLKKQDYDLCTCNISEAFKKTLEDVIAKELPKFIGNSKEKNLSEDQLRKISSFEVLTGITR